MENQEEQQKLERSYKRRGMQSFMKTLVKGKADFYVRIGSECTELIFDTIHNVYATENKNFPKNKIFLFNLVSRDAKKYLDKNGLVIVTPQKKTSEWNWDYDDEVGTLTGTDLDHAYWRIAYVKNYISKKTYEYGMDETAKALRLATISVLGREKKYLKYEDGEYVGEVVRQEKNEALHDIFTDIRHSCFYMMWELSQLLKEDFFCWKTDCIYYRDSEENRKIVSEYLDEREMLYKQLVF